LITNELPFLFFFLAEDVVTGTDCNFKPKETERLVDSQSGKERNDDERVSFLYSAWSAMLTKPNLEQLKLNGEISVPKAPHLENCRLRAQVNQRLDKPFENVSFPPWAGWKGLLDMHPAAATDEQQRYRRQARSENAYPPWVCFFYLQFINSVITLEYLLGNLLHLLI
jgi:hypothetical protein